MLICNQRTNRNNQLFHLHCLQMLNYGKLVYKMYLYVYILRQNSNLSHLYNGGFKWEYRLLRLIQNNKSNDRKFNIDNISLITWNKDSAYAMAEFDFRFNSNTKTHRIRQYWMQNQDDWKIVHESIF